MDDTREALECAARLCDEMAEDSSARFSAENIAEAACHGLAISPEQIAAEEIRGEAYLECARRIRGLQDIPF